MNSYSVHNSYSGYDIVERQEDPFPLSIFCGSAYTFFNWQNELPLQESCFDVYPLMESFVPADPFLYPSLDIVQSPTIIQEDINGLCVWNELGSVFDPQSQMLLLCDNETVDSSSTSRERKARRKCRSEEKINNSISKGLTRETISKYFYMPITQAAQGLNVGLTLLKKRCRELGIRRWPHRKLMSLQTLIKNVQEMKKVEGEESEGKLKEAIEILEREKKLLEEMPDMQLENKTKRLRQACFKANYKKRKLMGMTLHGCSSSGSTSHASSEDAVLSEDDDEEIKLLLNEPVFHANNLMF